MVSVILFDCLRLVLYNKYNNAIVFLTHLGISLAPRNTVSYTSSSAASTSVKFGVKTILLLISLRVIAKPDR